MAVTFTRAADRVVRQQRLLANRFAAGDIVLLAASSLVLIAIGLAYTGRIRGAGAVGSRTG